MPSSPHGEPLSDTNSLSLQKEQWHCQRVKYPACSAPLAHPVALSLTGHQQTHHRCSLTSHKRPWQSALRWLPSVLNTVSDGVHLSSAAPKQAQNTNKSCTHLTMKRVCHFYTRHSMQEHGFITYWSTHDTYYMRTWICKHLQSCSESHYMSIWQNLLSYHIHTET